MKDIAIQRYTNWLKGSYFDEDTRFSKQHHQGSLNSENKGVVIAYDSRKMSREFCEEAVLVLAANGIKC